MSNFTFPSETVKLPSQGLLYSSNSPLSSGELEIKYMSAKEEDIITNIRYIDDGTVLPRLLKSLVVNKEINVDDLLMGDYEAALIAARILAYGKNYKVQYALREYDVDLSAADPKQVDWELLKASNNVNKFSYKLPNTGNELEFKLLTLGDIVNIEKEIQGLQKMDKTSSPIISTQFIHSILSVNGDNSPGTVRSFVNSGAFITRDTQAFREYVKSITPQIDLRYYPDNGPTEGVKVPVNIAFFWPDGGISDRGL